MLRIAVALAFTAFIGWVEPTAAEVTRFEVTGSPQAAFNGKEFGDAGRYERLVGARDPVARPGRPAQRRHRRPRPGARATRRGGWRRWRRW